MKLYQACIDCLWGGGGGLGAQAHWYSVDHTDHAFAFDNAFAFNNADDAFAFDNVLA